MPLSGTLSSMSLPDLLQWLGNGRKTGTLEVERNKVVRRIVFQDGRVVACSSDEPAQLLGHYLVSRGKMTEETLRTALARQETTRQHLGQVLVDMAVVTHEELAEHLAAKAEETIFSLFDWDDAAFRFLDTEPPPRLIFPVDLRVDEILLRGAHRYDEMSRIREVFHDPGMVLRHTERAASQDVFRNRMGRRIYDLVNGEKTVAEILLHAHASEYLVYKFLFELFRAGFVKVESVFRVQDEMDLLPDEFEDEAAFPAHAELQGGVAATVAAPPARTAPKHSPASTEADLSSARQLMDRGEFDAAIDVLDSLYKAEPNHDSLRRLLGEAEAAFIDKAYKHYLPANRVPTLVRSVDELTRENITPNEFFLLSRIDGVWDLKSIIQVSPLREVDALRAMKRMREKGFIEFREDRDQVSSKT